MFDLDVIAAAVRRAVADGLSDEQITDAVDYARRNPSPASTSRVGVPKLPELTYAKPHSGGGASCSPEISVLVIRDPDSANSVRAYHRGRRINASVYQVDAGAGHSASEWAESRREAIAATSGDLRDDLDKAYGDPPVRDYIVGHQGTHQ